jgi:ATPase subunit of ABC transporter with duplicated ATPase domains
MPVLQAFNITHQFDNGEILFRSLTCSMTKRLVGLVGRNGAGKSVLGAIFSGQQIPTSGTVTIPKSVVIYRQKPSELLSGSRTVAQVLDKSLVLEALQQIESGSSASKWFDVVGDNWDAEAHLRQQLKQMGLPNDPHLPCNLLSGGQIARLQLWKLFESDSELLILDEPSNHLDEQAKQWLIKSIHSFKGSILLISHDRELLREVEEIWELSSLGLRTFGGHYDFYFEQKQLELLAVNRQIASIDKQQKQLEAQGQRNKEKAEQRASQGNKLRKNGSQPKILLDGKKNSAEASASNRNKNEQLRQTHLQNKEKELKSRQEQLKRPKLYLNDSAQRSRKVISMIKGLLPFVTLPPITLQVFANDKLHLTGDNGSGKSTLLKTLLGQHFLTQGELHINTPLHYLDQHFGIVRDECSMLENLKQHCEGINESDARTLLAGIGFRRDCVFRLGGILSGGEKMKLAMLMVSHQPTQPLLLLDEPDNHLDLDSKIILAKALQSYEGGFILISHDRDFAQESGVTGEINLH